MSSRHYPTRVAERDTLYPIKHSILPSKGQCNTSCNIWLICNQLPQPHFGAHTSTVHFHRPFLHDKYGVPPPPPNNHSLAPTADTTHNEALFITTDILQFK